MSVKGSVVSSRKTRTRTACAGSEQGSETQPEIRSGPDWEQALPWTLGPEPKPDPRQVGCPWVTMPKSRQPHEGGIIICYTD